VEARRLNSKIIPKGARRILKTLLR